MENKNTVNTKKIAKNTIILYARTIVTMFIALFTSRIVLQNLGVEDYGLYNVVGGFVALITVVVAGLRTATQRFLAYEIGRGDRDNLRIVFSSCFYTILGLVFIVLVIAETIGLWFLNNKLNIPEGRMVAANFVYQFSILHLCIELIIIPYSAFVISHERMTIYAYLGILDAVLKLIIAYVIAFSNSDRLILYGGLMILVSAVNFSIYKYICNKDYLESKLMRKMDKSMLKRIFSFSSWTMLGQGAMVCAHQGNNILVNIFYSVTANAASGIANQVNAALTGLTNNFFSAYQPQITKAYAVKDYKSTLNLVYGATKLSFFLIFLVAVPILINIDDILKIWLGVVPEYTNTFCLIIIASSIINSFGNPCWTVIFASGRIKLLQIMSAVFYLLDILLVYVFFSLGLPVYFAPLGKLMVDCCITILRVFIAKKHVAQFSVRHYINKVFFPILLSAIPIISFAYLMIINANTPATKIIYTFIIVVISLIITFYIGLSKSERRGVMNYVKKMIKKNG